MVVPNLSTDEINCTFAGSSVKLNPFIPSFHDQIYLRPGLKLDGLCCIDARHPINVGFSSKKTLIPLQHGFFFRFLPVLIQVPLLPPHVASTRIQSTLVGIYLQNAYHKEEVMQGRTILAAAVALVALGLEMRDGPS